MEKKLFTVHHRLPNLAQLIHKLKIAWNEELQANSDYFIIPVGKARIRPNICNFLERLNCHHLNCS